MKSLIFGIIQGLTEFLPISSSAHLFIFNNLVGFTKSALSFFIVLHFATLLSIIFFLQKDILNLLRKFRYLVLLFIITLITAIIGIIFDNCFDSLFDNNLLIYVALLINGIILITLKTKNNERSFQDMRYRDAILIGLIQGIAVFPGISRSGITITSLIRLGFKPQFAFQLSFLMAIPIIAGSLIFKSKEILTLDLAKTEIFIGGLSAFIFGLFALFIVRKALYKCKLPYFGYYCLLISLSGIGYIVYKGL